MIFSNDRTYEIFKWVVTVVLPALGTLILTIGQIWGWTTITVPIAATVVAIEGFLAACLCVGSKKYKLLNTPDADESDEPEG